MDETMRGPSKVKSQENFLTHAEAFKVSSNLFDHTNDLPTDPRPDEPTGYATRLTGGNTNAIYGLAKTLSVMPGDVISAEVYAKYIDVVSANWSEPLRNLLTSISQGTYPAGVYIDGGAAGSLGGTPFPYIGTLTRPDDTGTGPKAYLNYLIFDRNYAFKTGGYKRISSTPKENGGNVRHELLSFKDNEKITITEAGYVYIYLSNENDTPVEVYFDDFKVTHTKKTSIVQSDDYYPFGLTFNSYRRENSLPNFYQYNGKEVQDELSIGWLDYGARMYMPELGRWSVIDPMANLLTTYSPYNYTENNPINLIDPDGMFSTHTDSTGNVLAVYQDGDLGVYRHDGAETKEDVDKRRKETMSKSGGGENMGETEYWDEFVVYDGEGELTGEAVGRILFGESWNFTLFDKNLNARKVGLEATAIKSLPDGEFDIKVDSKIAPNGQYTGKLLNGKYASARSAGNYLAGYNAATTTNVFGDYVTKETFYKLAGRLHNFSGGEPPYYGEIPYAGRRIDQGYSRGAAIREKELKRKK